MAAGVAQKRSRAGARFIAPTNAMRKNRKLRRISSRKFWRLRKKNCPGLLHGPNDSRWISSLPLFPIAIPLSVLILNQQDKPIAVNKPQEQVAAAAYKLEVAQDLRQCRNRPLPVKGNKIQSVTVEIESPADSR